ncbi:unnamed protein product [Lathyrus oleraceus]
MQMREHMAHILKFVNVIIIFLLIFVVVIDGIVVTVDIKEIFKCESNKQCRKQMPNCKHPKIARPIYT